MSAGLKRSQLIDQMSKTTQEGAASSAGYRIAASNATDLEKAEAHVTCDATADEEQINDAFAAASSSGGVVSLSSGDFYLSSPIIFDDSYLTLEGKFGATVLRPINSFNANIIQIDNSEQRYGCTLRNFRINGNASGQSSGNAIDWSGMMNGQILNIDISNVKDDGIYANAQTLGASTTVANRVSGCRIASCGSDAIYLRYIYAWVIDGNPYLNATANGIYLSSCGDITIANNAMDQCRHGIYFYDSWRVKIIGNRYIGYCSEWGIKLTGSANTNPYEIVIVGNGIAENVTGGIYVNKGNQILIADNHINKTDSLAQTTGIKLDSTCSNVRIANNILDNTTTEISNSCTSADISGNVGYIAPGEIRTLEGSIATLTQNAYNSVDNPFGQDVLVLDEVIYISTKATSGSPRMDCGIGNSATTDYTTLFDDITCETVGPYHSVHTATIGKQTSPIVWKSASGNRYLNHSIKAAAATGMVATYTVRVMGV